MIKKTIIGLTVCSLFCIKGLSQQIKLELRLKKDVPDSSIHLRNYTRGINISISPDGRGNFKGNLNIPAKGFYTLDRVGQVYLEPGKALRITQEEESNYTFKGKQAKENELLAKLHSVRKRLIPLNQVIENTPDYAVLRQTVPEFAQTVKTYKDSVAIISSQSADPFFRELAIGDADSYTRLMLDNFSSWHGADAGHYNDLLTFVNDPKSKDDPYFERRLMRALYLPTLKSFLNQADKATVKKMFTDGFVQDDINLFANSEWYGLVLSRILFADNTVDQKKMKESYLERIKQIEARFADKSFANYLIGQQGIEYMTSAQFTRFGVEQAYETLKALALPGPSKEMIEKAYRKIKGDRSL